MTEPEDPTLPPGAVDGAGEADELEELDQVVEEEVVELAVVDAPGVALDEGPPAPVAEPVTGAGKPQPARGARPDLIDRREPLYRECKGYRLRLDPPDLARLRELPGSRGRSDDENGEAFFDGQAERLASAIADDVPTPSEIRVVVDPYSRQAFLALENRIRGILSF